MSVEHEDYYISEKEVSSDQKNDTDVLPNSHFCVAKVRGARGVSRFATPSVYKLSAISFTEFFSAILWNIFCNKNKPAEGELRVSEYQDTLSWISAFFEYSLNTHFYDTLLSLDLVFSAKNIAELRDELILKTYELQWSSRDYKNSSDLISQFNRSLIKVLTLLDYDSEIAQELANEYTSTWSVTGLKKAPRKDE